MNEFPLLEPFMYRIDGLAWRELIFRITCSGTHLTGLHTWLYDWPSVQSWVNNLSLPPHSQNQKEFILLCIGIVRFQWNIVHKAHGSMSGPINSNFSLQMLIIGCWGIVEGEDVKDKTLHILCKAVASHSVAVYWELITLQQLICLARTQRSMEPVASSAPGTCSGFW